MLVTYKGLMIILDGLGDRAIPSFGGKTPLEVAHTPNMDRLARAGQCGLVDPLVPGMPVGTHTGVAMLFGLTLKQTTQLARGPVEATGIGLSGNQNALYFRCNFASLKKDGAHYKILDRRAGRISTDTDILAAAVGRVDLGDHITASLHPATQHRVVLKLEGPDLSDQVSNTDPGGSSHTLSVLTCLAHDPANTAAARTAKAINHLTDIVYRQLKTHKINVARKQQGRHPANGIICHCPGRLPRIRSLIQQLKLNAAVVSGEKTIIGIGKMVGHTLYENPAFTANRETNLHLKIETAQQALVENDLVYLHIKATDLFSHDLNPNGKREMLARIDDAIAPLITDERVVAITADHSTDSNTGRHTGDPVPSLIYNPCGRVDGCETFSESACAAGGLGRINSNSFLLTLLDQMNRLDNYSPKDRPFVFWDNSL
jgi:2,3-bisphosphoglycerate-independent phosphoglycerate mutase